jgi:DnaK suppressor protein
MSEATNSRRSAGAPASSPPPRGPSLPARPPAPTSRTPEDDAPASLTDEQLRSLRARLDERREQLLASIETRREQERDSTREVGDEMDEANTEGVSAMTSKLLERDMMELREIDRAIARMEEGTYGACEGTGEPIGYARLSLRPWARFSVAYQEELERAARSRGAS